MKVLRSITRRPPLRLYGAIWVNTERREVFFWLKSSKKLAHGVS
jgi:hypothetical protein